MMTVRALLAILVLGLLMRSGLAALCAPLAVSEDERMVLRWLTKVAECAFLFWMPVLVFRLRRAELIRLTGALPGWRACGLAALYGVVLLAFASSEAAVETLAVAQFDRAFAYRFWAFPADAPPGAYDASEWMAMFLRVAVLVPIVEEYFFRGLLVPALRKARGMRAAAITSSCLFTLLHYPRLYLVSTLVFSLALAYLYMASGSLLLCIAIHASFNAAVLVLENPGWYLLARTADHIDQPGAWAPELAVFLASSVILLHGFFRYRHAIGGEPAPLLQKRSYSAR